MFLVCLRNVVFFLSVGIVVGLVVLFGYYVCYGIGNDMNYVFVFIVYFCFVSMNVFCSKYS